MEGEGHAYSEAEALRKNTSRHVGLPLPPYFLQCGSAGWRIAHDDNSRKQLGERGRLARCIVTRLDDRARKSSSAVANNLSK